MGRPAKNAPSEAPLTPADGAPAEQPPKKRRKAKRRPAPRPAAAPRVQVPMQRRADPGRREYPMLADLPPVPKYRTDPATGEVLYHLVPREVNGVVTHAREPVPFDPNGELEHRNRWGRCLMFKFTLQRLPKGEKRKFITVNDRRYTVLRGVEVIVPWFVVSSMADRIERHYDPVPDPQRPGRSITVHDDVLADNFTARPIDACDDFDMETAFKPKSGVEALDHVRQSREDSGYGNGVAPEQAQDLGPVVSRSRGAPLPDPTEQPLIAR